MKNKIILAAATLIIASAAVTLVTAKVMFLERTAITETTLNGRMYVYHFSKPTDSYKVIGRVKAKMTLTGTPTELFNSIIKQVEKDYPGAEGLIFDDWLQSAQVIIYTDSK
jgi:uncharacterized protein YgiM (DUF1202 family)